ESGRGWCVDVFLAPSDAAPAKRSPAREDVVYVDTDGINLRDDAAIDAKVNVILLAGETGTVVDGPRQADGHTWFQVKSSRGSGWAASRYLRVGNPDPINRTKISVGDAVGLSTDGINVRADTSLSAEVIKILLAGDVVNVVQGPTQAEGYIWFRLATDLGEGWAVDQHLTVESAATLTTGDTARVIEGELNLRAGASGGAEIIGVLADGAYVDIIDGMEEMDGRRWVRVQSSRFGSGWSAAEFLIRS
ncbi:MAG: SH3 domain-containing protein, partial [Chloroflexota bacterium]|nr:SH3 domain-containing protein [Chloroflexota bacterium]